MDSGNGGRARRAEEVYNATLKIQPDKRDDFLSAACEGDPELKKRVESLIGVRSATEGMGGMTAASGQTGSFNDAPTVALSEEQQQELFCEPDIGPYRIVRLLGQGGMGAVYLAERNDDQFRKRAAIKLIKRGMDTEFVLRRFLNERQILASLDHPNIARLLDGGTTRDGRPYFVMEYVEGRPITKYCDDEKLSTVQRLHLFQRVCLAVHYAHQNLVIHRDIKPSNILVTEEGVPKLLDFGIAKLLNPELASETIEATAAAIRLMTPEYASPEQAKGEQITTATDVYSLGVVLYELLTGHRPYRLTSHLPHEIIKVICGVEPDRPSTAVARTETIQIQADSPTTTITPESVSRTREGQPDKLRRRLRGDLDNIVLMAMRKEPHRRYSSVAQLSNDIERHLDAKPVIARRDTFWYRGGKFVRRNKLAMVATVLIFAMLVGAIVATTVERRKAERRFNDVRALANSFLFEFHDAIKDLPGSTPARELVTKKALEYLDGLAGEASGDGKLQRELAAAYDKVGDLQGGLYQGSLGDTDGARASYDKALRIRQALAIAQPSSDEVQTALSDSYGRLAGLSWTTGDPAGAAELYRKALEIDERLAAAAPADSKKQYTLAGSYLNHGFMLAASNKIDEGYAVLRKAQPILESLVEAEGENEKYRDGLGTAYERMAMVLDVGKQTRSEALLLYRKSLAIREGLLAGSPINTDYRRGVAASLSNIGDVQMKLDDRSGAIVSYRKALAIFSNLSDADPQNGQFRQDAGLVSANLGMALAATGDGKQALAESTRAREILEELLKSDPSSAILRFRVAIAEESLGNACAALAADKTTPAGLRTQYWREALAWFEKALKTDRELRDNGTIVGDEAQRVDVIASRIAECNAALSKPRGVAP